MGAQSLHGNSFVYYGSKRIKIGHHHGEYTDGTLTLNYMEMLYIVSNVN